ncbi:MAG: DUF2087 domain-containing protein [Chloroflexota bacterium]
MTQQPNFSPEQLPIAEFPDHLRHTVIRATLREKDPNGVYANLKEPVAQQKDTYHEMLKIALRIRGSKRYTQAQIDELIEKHHGGDPGVVRAAMIEEEMIEVLEDGTYTRPQGRKLP